MKGIKGLTVTVSINQDCLLFPDPSSFMNLVCLQLYNYFPLYLQYCYFQPIFTMRCSVYLFPGNRIKLLYFTQRASPTRGQDKTPWLIT